MKFLNLAKRFEFSSKGVFKPEMGAVFVGSGGKFAPPKGFLVVCDAGTLAIASNFGEPYKISFASLAEALRLKEKLAGYEGVLSVGSGCVFDVCKYASFLAGKGFIGFATALSMNGYFSSTASLVAENGLKQSFNAGLAQGVYFDLAVIKKAPISLTKAGLGDSLAMCTAWNDCLLSHKTKGTKYMPELFEFRLPSQEFLIENHHLLNEGDDEFLLQLLENIVFAGASMHIYGSSFPASGGEHAMAHVAELEFPQKMKGFYHGLQIAGFTVEMLKIQSEIAKTPSEFNVELLGVLPKIYEKLKMPSSFASFNLTAEEFTHISKKATKIRERYGFLSVKYS